jgi:nucleoid-associated protein YgaU
MRACGPALGPPPEWRKSILCCAVLLSLLAIETRGQEVADAARQEKARKETEPKSLRHVYTEEDLKRKVILTPEDQERVEARKHQQGATPAEQTAKQAPNDTNPQTESLGEIARRFRQEKAARDAELAARKKFSPFLYQVPGDSLAEPNSGALGAPEAGADPMAPPIGPVRRHAPNVFPPAVTPRGRISPFQPRPLHSPPSTPPAALLMVPGLTAGVPNVAPPTEKSLPTEPVNARMRHIEVQRGQCWWKLAEYYLGNGARWPELRKWNADAGGPPELLKRGTVVVVPEAAGRGEFPSQIVKVQKGDSLWLLAEEHLGRGSAWTCLASANPQIVDYTHMAVGTLVRLPVPDARRSYQSQFPGKAKQ